MKAREGDIYRPLKVARRKGSRGSALPRFTGNAHWDDEFNGSFVIGAAAPVFLYSSFCKQQLRLIGHLGMICFCRILGWGVDLFAPRRKMYTIGLPFPAPSPLFLVLRVIGLPERWKNSICSKLKY